MVAVCAVLAAALAGGTLWWVVRGDDHPPPGLMIRFDDTSERAGCVYDAAGRRVRAAVRVDGWAPQGDHVTITVTAYSDENTSDEVGAAIATVQVRGTVHERVALSIPVDAAPHVDEDGVAACRLSPVSVDY